MALRSLLRARLAPPEAGVSYGGAYDGDAGEQVSEGARE
jgi:hypothetical protein